jgi:ribosome-associated protein
MSSTTPLPLTDVINHTLSDYKAFDVAVLNVATISSFTENMIIASATSNRHAKALADHCIDAAKKAHFPVLSIQGEAEAEWILVDFGNVILHVMQAKTRDFYQLEKLWSVRECEIA